MELRRATWDGTTVQPIEPAVGSMTVTVSKVRTNHDGSGEVYFELFRSWMGSGACAVFLPVRLMAEGPDPERPSRMAMDRADVFDPDVLDGARRALEFLGGRWHLGATIKSIGNISTTLTLMFRDDDDMIVYSGMMAVLE